MIVDNRVSVGFEAGVHRDADSPVGHVDTRLSTKLAPSLSRGNYCFDHTPFAILEVVEGWTSRWQLSPHAGLRGAVVGAG